jgi:hypothetical protein
VAHVLESRGNPVAPSIPSGANFSGTTVCFPPDPRLLSSLINPSASAALPSSALFPVPAAPKWNKILTWLIAWQSTHFACAPEFLMLCILLVHRPIKINLNASSCCVRPFLQPGEKQLLAPQPSACFFNTCTLLPADPPHSKKSVCNRRHRYNALLSVCHPLPCMQSPAFFVLLRVTFFE